MKLLIKTTDELKRYLPNVVSNTGLESFDEALTEATENELIKIISQAQYDELFTLYDADEIDADSIEEKLLSHCQKVIANLAAFSLVDTQVLKFSDQGLHVFHDDTSKTPFQHQIESAKKRYKQKADRALDDLTTFLHENEDSLITWASSTAYSLYKDLLITNTATFDKYVRISNSRSTWLALRRYQRQAEESFVKNYIGEEFYLEIIAEIAEGEISAATADLLKRLEPAAAHLAMSYAVVSHPVVIKEDGIILKEIDTNKDTNKVESAVVASMLARLSNHHRRQGLKWLNKAEKFLQAKASQSLYSTFFASDIYQTADYKPVNVNERDGGESPGIVSF